ncbi:MAG: diaminopropionate ammonia-lyase [Acidobacteriota bacterium]
MCEFSFNQFRKDEPEWEGAGFAFLKNHDMLDFHRTLRGYEATKIVPLKSVSKNLGLKDIIVKDESTRFGIKAFKALGASYAIFRVLKKKWESEFGTEFNFNIFKEKNKLKKLGKMTFCAASDGNHGRAVAWTAGRLGQNAVIYMPGDTVRSRIDNIKSEGSDVVLVEGTYDDCVRKISEDALKHNWIEIGDTAYQGYTEIPSWVLNGYTTIFRELESQMGTLDLLTTDIVILQAGVGAFAAAGASYLSGRFGKKRPKIVITEPVEAAGFLESVKFGKGEAIPASGKMETIMAGLNCGVPSLVAWPILRDSADLFISIHDKYAEQAMRVYASEGVVSGESGASGLAALIALMKDKGLEEAKGELGLGADSRVIVINTEGDTDPVNYKKTVGV